MPINYKKLSKKNKPLGNIKTLLIGEAPPPNGTTYFYLPGESRLHILIEDDNSLPATIFNHYFDNRPNDKIEYQKFLDILKQNGIFLIDMHEKLLQIRLRKELKLENVEKVRQQIPMLKERIKNIKGVTKKTKVIFLMPHPVYNAAIHNFFTNPTIKSWKEFRMDTSEVLDY
jgi:hypothetical protein